MPKGPTGKPAPFGVEIYEPGPEVPGAINFAITDENNPRSDVDRRLDAGRKPGEVLGFLKINAGQRVGELFAGTGYTTELLGRTIGEHGKVFAQNSKEVLDKFARGPLTERLKKPVLQYVVMLETPHEDPFPPDARGLDVVLSILNYHDYVWQKVDRAKLNAAVFAALKPGGFYGIVDHSAAQGSGLRDVETLHRIDEEVVKQEVLAAGFRLDAESPLLRYAADKRDWNASPKSADEAKKRGTSDRFVLRFVKP